MKLLEHQHVVKAYECDFNAKLDCKGVLTDVMMLVTELADGGELFAIIEGTGAFSADLTRFYFK